MSLEGKGQFPAPSSAQAIIGVLNNGMSIVGANDYWQQVITGIVLFSVVVIRQLEPVQKEIITTDIQKDI